MSVGAVAGIVDQPMQTFTRPAEANSTAGSTARGVISGVGKGIVGVFTKPIGGAAELVSQTGYGKKMSLLKSVILRNDHLNSDLSNQHFIVYMIFLLDYIFSQIIECLSIMEQTLP